jgi:hypothetical protein
MKVYGFHGLLVFGLILNAVFWISTVKQQDTLPYCSVRAPSRVEQRNDLAGSLVGELLH